jgi:dTMP kinase
MDESRGIFIVIEGSDGSGKATQLARVKQRLEAAGHSVETFDFPRYDEPSSYFVKRYLDGAYGGADDVGPYTSSLFYALDRFEAAPKIREALKAGKVVISNRYTGSNMAHQGTKISNAEQRRGFFIWLDNLEFEMLRIPRPDISFVLRVPTEVSIRLMADKAKDIHESDPKHLERTLAVYDDMTQLFPKDFQRIDCVRSGQMLDVETVNMMLWEKVSPLLPKPSATAQAKASAKTEVTKSAETKTEVPVAKPSKSQQLVVDNASG